MKGAFLDVGFHKKVPGDCRSDGSTPALDRDSAQHRGSSIGSRSCNGAYWGSAGGYWVSNAAC